MAPYAPLVARRWSEVRWNTPASNVAEGRCNMKRRKITAVLLASAFALSATAPTVADPDFGPGNSKKGAAGCGREVPPARPDSRPGRV